MSSDTAKQWLDYEPKTEAELLNLPRAEAARLRKEAKIVKDWLEEYKLKVKTTVDVLDEVQKGNLWGVTRMSNPPHHPRYSGMDPPQQTQTDEWQIEAQRQHQQELEEMQEYIDDQIELADGVIHQTSMNDRETQAFLEAVPPNEDQIIEPEQPEVVAEIEQEQFQMPKNLPVKQKRIPMKPRTLLKPDFEKDKERQKSKLEEGRRENQRAQWGFKRLTIKDYRQMLENQQQLSELSKTHSEEESKMNLNHPGPGQIDLPDYEDTLEEKFPSPGPSPKKKIFRRNEVSQPEDDWNYNAEEEMINSGNIDLHKLSTQTYQELLDYAKSIGKYVHLPPLEVESVQGQEPEPVKKIKKKTLRVVPKGLQQQIDKIEENFKDEETKINFVPVDHINDESFDFKVEIVNELENPPRAPLDVPLKTRISLTGMRKKPPRPDIKEITIKGLANIKKIARPSMGEAAEIRMLQKLGSLDKLMKKIPRPLIYKKGLTAKNGVVFLIRQPNFTGFIENQPEEVIDAEDEELWRQVQEKFNPETEALRLEQEEEIRVEDEQNKRLEQQCLELNMNTVEDLERKWESKKVKFSMIPDEDDIKPIDMDIVLRHPYPMTGDGVDTYIYEDQIALLDQNAVDTNEMWPIVKWLDAMRDKYGYFGRTIGESEIDQQELKFAVQNLRHYLQDTNQFYQKKNQDSAYAPMKPLPMARRTWDEYQKKFIETNTPLYPQVVEFNTYSNDFETVTVPQFIEPEPEHIWPKDNEVIMAADDPIPMVRARIFEGNGKFPIKVPTYSKEMAPIRSGLEELIYEQSKRKYMHEKLDEDEEDLLWDKGKLERIQAENERELKNTDHKPKPANTRKQKMVKLITQSHDQYAAIMKKRNRNQYKKLVLEEYGRLSPEIIDTAIATQFMKIKKKASLIQTSSAELIDIKTYISNYDKVNNSAYQQQKYQTMRKIENLVQILNEYPATQMKIVNEIGTEVMSRIMQAESSLNKSKLDWQEGLRLAYHSWIKRAYKVLQFPDTWNGKDKYDLMNTLRQYIYNQPSLQWARKSFDNPISYHNILQSLIKIQCGEDKESPYIPPKLQELSRDFLDTLIFNESQYTCTVKMAQLLYLHFKAKEVSYNQLFKKNGRNNKHILST